MLSPKEFAAVMGSIKVSDREISEKLNTIVIIMIWIRVV